MSLDQVVFLNYSGKTVLVSLSLRNWKLTWLEIVNLNLGIGKNLRKILGDLKENFTGKPDLLKSVFAALDIDSHSIF